MAKDGAILPVLAAAGEPPPDWSIPPVLRHPTWVAIILAGFHDVSTERAIGFGMGPIPWSAIVARGATAPPLGPGLKGPRLAAFVHAVRRCDGVYLAHQRRLIEEAGKSPAPRPPEG